MVLLFGRLYELRAEKAAEGGAKVVVVGPPCAGKTTFIKQFLEPKLKERFGDSSRGEEGTAGLAPGKEKAQVDLREVIRRIFARRYVSGREAAEELKDINGADHLMAFKRLPRDFVEYLKERYRGYSLYLFYISPDAGEDGDVVERLLKAAERVDVEFKWLGLEYVPPGVAAMLKERGEDYVEEQLRLYREVLNEFGAAGDRLAKLRELGKDAVEKAGERVLEKFAGVAEELAKALLPLLPGGVVVGAVMGVASYFLSGHRKWRDWIRLLADWSRLDSRLRDLAAAHIALELGVGKEEVRDVLDSLSNKELEKLEGKVKELYDKVEELWDEVIAQTLAKYGDVYTRRRAEGLRVTYHKVVDAGVEYRLVTAGRFTEEAEEVKKLLVERGFVVVAGSRGIGKSTLAAYVAYDMLKKGDVDYVVKIKKPIDVSEVDVFKTVGRRALLIFDIYPREVYLEKFDPRRPLEELYGSVEVLLSLAALAERSREAGAGLYALAAVHDKALAETHKGKAVKEWLEGAFFYVPRLNTPEFLAGVLKSYACPNEDDCCLDKVDIERLVSLISSHDAYTLVAKYAGLWLRERGCDAGDVERAVEEAKKEPKLFFANYIWHVLLRGSSDSARRVAVPLLLHAVFGPAPVGVTYVTKAVNDRGIWRFLKPEELEDARLESLREEALEPIAKWLAQQHEDLLEETLRDLAGLNGEEARKPYREALGDLVERLDWARDEALKAGDKILAELGISKEALKICNKILAELGVPEEDLELGTALLAFVNQRLAAVFRGDESKGCWQRVAFVAGHALAGYPKLPKRGRLSKDVVEALGDALKPCAVDKYLVIDGVMPPLLIGVAQLMPIRELNILSPFADTETIDDVRKTAEGLLARWRRRDLNLHEAFYALGLAVLAARGKVDGKTADRLLHATSFAVQEVAHPAAVLPILAALRPLGKKAPHKYVVMLAAASELRTLDPETVRYIYDALQQLKDRLTETGHLWPLAEAIRAYSNLMRRHPEHIRGHRKEAVADMCELYSKVREHSVATAPGSGLSAQLLFDTIAKVYVLAVALRSGDLTQHVQWHCGLGDLEEEAKDVMCMLDMAEACPEELIKIKEDFADWVRARDVTEDAKRAIEDLRARLTHVLARYKLNHALDAEKLEEAAKEFEKVAEIRKRLKHWGGYLIARSLALRARVFAARSWGELLERAEGFWDLWEEVKKHRKPTARYLATAALPLGEYLVYLAASGDRGKAEELLKKWQWLLDYDPRASVNARLMLKLFGVGEGAKLEEVVDVFESLQEFQPALWLLTGRLKKDEALRRCEQRPKPEDCVDAVEAATGDQEAVGRLKFEIKWEVSVASLLLDTVDGKTPVEVLAPKYPSAQLAFTLLAAVEGRVDAVRLHGLWGSARFRKPLLRQLSHAVYENCGDLNSEECRMALLKLYYYHV